ncbi:ATP-binding protein [Acetonema longum]|uniref:ATPase associated with various cellular activities AAA_5 n=1 Tax=Acetonema longum DSM 6540 TaxID=1009370 RepID=F7NJB1_9FIRM|nr:ATP-binding protein [Acetonema longum]EGO63859.1 ATPase associated with various cellular activities AAA_5 [Acetonema longum DSM 6540]
MNFIDTLKSVDLVLATGEVPLIVGETGVGKTALAKQIAQENHWSFIVIDGNLLKEGEIGGLPTIESYTGVNRPGDRPEKKTTVYAVHHKLREIDEATAAGKTVLLLIDEINRCEHAVQQELMNLILNREINGYKLPETVKIIAAMNPSGKYGEEFDYQVVDMDAAQENRFVWLPMEPDPMQWVDWAMNAGLEPKVIEFISTFPEYLHKTNENDIKATPRSYERISHLYKVYQQKKDSVPRPVFFNVVRGNVGKLIAEELVHFLESDYRPLISYEDVFAGSSLAKSVSEKIKTESHTRLYLAAKNMLSRLETNIKAGDYDHSTSERLIEFLKLYPVDLMVGIMKDIKNSYSGVYEYALENEAFVEAYFAAYRSIR